MAEDVRELEEFRESLRDKPVFGALFNVQTNLDHVINHMSPSDSKAHDCKINRGFVSADLLSFTKGKPKRMTFQQFYERDNALRDHKFYDEVIKHLHTAETEYGVKVPDYF